MTRHLPKTVIRIAIFGAAVSVLLWRVPAQKVRGAGEMALIAAKSHGPALAAGQQRGNRTDRLTRSRFSNWLSASDTMVL
jgi:hypothetical protein